MNNELKSILWTIKSSPFPVQELSGLDAETTGTVPLGAVQTVLKSLVVPSTRLAGNAGPRVEMIIRRAVGGRTDPVPAIVWPYGKLRLLLGSTSSTRRKLRLFALTMKGLTPSSPAILCTQLLVPL